MADQHSALQDGAGVARQIMISIDQLAFNERGELVIRNQDLARALWKALLAEALAAASQAQVAMGDKPC